jgi:hypothetical protein
MLMRTAVAVGACGVLLAACGSTRSAAITAALRRLQAEFEQARDKAGPQGKDILGSTTLIYAPPPRGVSAAEWQTAVPKDQALQRAIARASR